MQGGLFSAKLLYPLTQQKLMDLIPPAKLPEVCRTACQACACVFHGHRSLQRCCLGTATTSVCFHVLCPRDPFNQAMGALTKVVITNECQTNEGYSFSWIILACLWCWSITRICVFDDDSFHLSAAPD